MRAPRLEGRSVVRFRCLHTSKMLQSPPQGCWLELFSCQSLEPEKENTESVFSRLSVTSPKFHQPKDTKLSTLQATGWACGKGGCHSPPVRGFHSTPPRAAVQLWASSLTSLCQIFLTRETGDLLPISLVEVTSMRRKRSARGWPPGGTPHISLLSPPKPLPRPGAMRSFTSQALGLQSR